MATAVEVTKKSVSRKEVIGWLITISLPGLFMLFVPNSETINFQQKLFFAVTLFYILMTAFELVDNIVVCFMLPVTYLLFKLAPAAQIFSPWLGTIPWMVIAGFLMANVMLRIGLLQRIAFWCVIKSGSTYNGIIWGFAFAGIILNLVAPGKVYIPMATIALGLCTALNLGHSKTAAGIFMAGAYAAILPMTFLYTPSGAGILYSIMSSVTPVSITWLGFLFHWAVYVIIYFGAFYIVSKVFKSDVEFEGRSFFEEKMKNLGSISKAEKKAVVLVILFMIFMLTGSIHKIDIAWGFVFIAVAFYLPGIKIGTREDVNKIQFSMVLFITAFMAIGTVSNAVGAGKIISDLVLPFFDQNNPFVLYGMVALLGFIMNFLLTPMAGYATLIPPLTQIAVDLGINPVPVVYSLSFGLGELILPYEIALYLIFFSYGYMSLKDFMKIGAIKALFAFIFFMVIMIPYWLLIGLI
ncbi:MAG: SLC13 family permease [Dehalobacterium sp.]